MKTAQFTDAACTSRLTAQETALYRIVKTALAAGAIVALATPALSYEQSESPENNGRNIQQVQPGPMQPLTQIFQVRQSRATREREARAAEERYFQRATGNIW
jgi:hypothetical protein